MFIGSSSGAAVHMAAAMGVPWLPQTFLIPVKTPDLSADAPIQRMEWAKPWTKQMLDNCYEKALKEAIPSRYPTDQLLSPDLLTSFS